MKVRACMQKVSAVSYWLFFFFLSLETVPEVLSKVNSSQFFWSFPGNLSLRRRRFGNKKSIVCKLIKEEVHLLYFFLGRCELSVSITQDKSTPAL